MTHNKISFDLDDVLAFFCETMMEELERVTGIKARIDAMNDYSLLHEQYKLDAFPHELIIEKQLLERAPVHPYAQEVISLLKDKGHDIMVVTARAWHPRAHDITQKWLDHHGLPIDELHVVDHGNGKREIFDRTPGILCHIDDAPAYVAHAAEHDHVQRAVVMDRPWNRHIQVNEPHLHRVSCLKDFASLLTQ